VALPRSFFLGGKDPGPGPNGVLLGLRGLLSAYAAGAAGTATKHVASSNTGLGRPGTAVHPIG
jgi:hypothetical protein